MSDIFVKTAGAGSTGWKKATNIFAKTAGLGSTGWKAATGVWIRNATQWLKVWPLSGIFASRVPYISNFSSDPYTSRLTTSNRIRIGTSYFGDNAVWDLNGWAASNYTYKWKLYDSLGQDTGIVLRSGTGSGWTSSAGEDQLPASIWTTTNSTNSDRQYLGFEATANASAGSSYSGLSVSSKIQVIRESPVNSTYSLSSLSPQVNVQLTYSSTWLTGEAYKAETTNIYWYTNLSASTTGGTYVGSGSTYTPVAADVGKYIYVVETRYNSGTDYDYGTNVGVSVSIITTSTVAEISYQVTGSQRSVSLPSNFTAGSNVYVSTNGFIGIGTDPTTSISIPGSGQFLSILQGDHVQTSLYYYSTSTNFFVRWSGYRLGNTAKTIEYQAKFTWNSSTVDVYFITNNLDTADYNKNAVYNNGTVTTTWANSTAATIALVATTSMTRNTSRDTVDDNNTLIVASLPAVAPTAGTATSTPATGTAGLATYTASATGTWTGTAPITYTYSWQYFSSSSYTYVEVATGQTWSPSSTFNTLYPNLGVRLVVRGTNSAGFAEATASVTVNTPITPTITVPTYSGITKTAGTINWTSTNQSTFALSGSFTDSGTTGTSVSKTGLSAGTTYSGTITVTSSTGNTASRAYSFTTTATVTPTITTPTYSNVANTTGTISWTSTNQSSFALDGSFTDSGTTGTSVAKTGLTKNTTYSGNITVTSSSGDTASKAYSFTTTNTATNVGNNKPQGNPTLNYIRSQASPSKWIYTVTIVKSTIGVPDPSYYLQWFAPTGTTVLFGTGPYTSAGLGGSFTTPEIAVDKTYSTYRVQAWATNGISGQDISNTGYSNIA